MGINFPASPLVGDLWPSPVVAGQAQYAWDGEKWTSGSVPATRAPIYAAPFDAMAYNGMQINGSMDVNQEGVSPTFTNTTKYCLDGWFGSTALSGGQVTIYQAPLTTEVPGLQNCMQMVVNTTQATLSGANYVRFHTNIEGYRFARAAWGTSVAMPVTVGFWVRVSAGGVYRALMMNFDGSAITAWIPFTAGGAFQWVTITFPAQTTGTWKTDNSNGAMFVFEMASSATPNTLASAGGFASITGVVVLPGIEAPSAARSPLIMRPYDQELVTCMRYFEKIGAAPINIYGSGSAQLPFRYVAKRATPTFTLVTPGQIFCGSGPYTPTSLGAANAPTLVDVELDMGVSGGGMPVGQGGLWRQGQINIDARL